MDVRRSKLKLVLGAGCALSVLAVASMASAEQRTFSVAPSRATDSIPEFAKQAGIQIVAPADRLSGVRTPAIEGLYDTREALAMLVAGTGLQIASDDGRTITLAPAPQGGSASGGAEGTAVEALIVTAQKREEDIQDVPIAISAFSQEQLERSQVAGGPDLMTQVPNMTFTKTNFSGYSIQIRGIGTQAISATTDPAVAVAFNNTPFIRNRFFEQEFYDLQRVEVLRGPQGTLYGRNATAGVVNVISAKPKFAYEAKVVADLSNFNSKRLEGMVNVPLVEDQVALRLAGAWTKRDGFVTNEITGNPIDGRDLWSSRLSLRFAPTDRLDANLIWEHFEEDDDRLRSGKQLCHTDEITEVAGFETTHFQRLPNNGQDGAIWAGVQATFSQGCKPGSMYAPEAFQTPNGLSLPYYVPLGGIGLPIALDDPYLSRTQSRDLRVIESTVDPSYKAKTDVVELQVAYDLTDGLTLSSETAWASDFIFSTQDFNRFNTAPLAWAVSNGPDPYDTTEQPNRAFQQGVLDENGVFCDPQIGCADRMVAVDLSTAKSSQFSQEFRLASTFEGPFNFSLGGNYLRYDTHEKYYLFINSLSITAALGRSGTRPMTPYEVGVTDNLECMPNGLEAPDPSRPAAILNCTYMDPNPIGSLNDLGHNYFLSKNPYKLISYAVFGEAYYNIAENLKVTAGLRWTVDKKEAPRIPTWLLASETAGFTVMEVIEQEWREPTGRLTIDWKPDLSFTDETLLYASYAHGYKAGGANPPPFGVAIYNAGDVAEGVFDNSATSPKVFDAEFVDAFEVGAKNTFLDGRMTLNAAAFYYDYKNYQISQIVDRSASNLNYDAEVWGLELEADWRPAENLRLGLKLGYEDTKVAEGEKAIDIMDRTAGQRGWILVRPFPSIPSNCVLPEWLFLGHRIAADGPGDDIVTNPELVNLGATGGGSPGACELTYLLDVDPAANQRSKGHHPDSIINYTLYSTDLADFPGWMGGGTITDRNYPGVDLEEITALSNNGQGFFKDLSGNELPNAPHVTATITADYTVPLPQDWLMTLHTDLYYQSEAWARIFNTDGYDKIKAYSNINLAAIFTNESAGWKVMAYVKNVLDRDAITGAFLFSDDTGLTTNVFLNEPRLYGLRVTKEWNGGPWWTGANPEHSGPYPLTVEISGQVQRHDAPYEAMAPSFIGEFSPALQPATLFNRDMDWGDGREVKVTYRPEGHWSISAGLRYGRTNTDMARLHLEEDGPRSCAFIPALNYLCPIYAAMYGEDAVYRTATNWSDSAARSSEEHTMASFEVGRDVGLGALGQSTVSAGLRYAQFTSRTYAEMSGIPDWYFPDGWSPAFGTKYPATSHVYDASAEGVREFDGTGPTLTWASSIALMDSDDAGRLGLDWSVGGGVLFGKQKTSIKGGESVGEFEGRYIYDIPRLTDPPPVVPIDVSRSQSVTAPLLDVSLGLSYEIQRTRIGAGYRWERYFDVLDVGAGESKDGDRTIDGPYFKIAVGFGG
jgi:outer membrane receptor protein involved in Fe transport